MKWLLPAKYLKHWQLFVFSKSLLNKNIVNENDLNRAEKALEKFVQDTETLYGQLYMRYNVHILLHATKYVRKYGALWAWSTFPFENFNGVMKTLFHGTQYIPQQICKMYWRLRFLKSKSKFFSEPERNERARQLFIKLMKQCSVKKCLEYGDEMKIFGVGKNKTLTVTQRILIERMLD